MNVLILAPVGEPNATKTNASTLYADLLNKGLKPENLIVKSDKFITDEITLTVNKRFINKILAFDVPLGTLECLVKKFSSIPKPPKIFSLNPANKNEVRQVKKGFLYLINCPTQVL